MVCGSTMPGASREGVSIWKMPMGGGVESQVHEGPLSYGTNWVLVKEGIYFTKLDGSLEIFGIRQPAIASDSQA